MTGWNELSQTVLAGLAATRPAEAVAVVLGLAYSVLAVGRSRWCWVSGALSSAIFIYLSLRARLPMQAALQIYYVAISIYGWWHWSREQHSHGNPAVSTWPPSAHVLAGAAVFAVSAVTSHWLASRTQAAWPFLDSLTSWGSLYATWLQARVKLENWLYWILIDSLLAFLFAAQGLYFAALLSVVYLAISAVGFMRWLKTYRTLATVG